MSFSLKGWKTLLLNAAVLIAALLELLAHFDLLTGGFIGLSATGAAIIAALSATNLVLRYLTTSPIFNADSPEAAEIKTKLDAVLASGGDVVEAAKEIVGQAPAA